MSYKIIDKIKYVDLLNEWQERLGLQDYVITLRYNCKFSDMETSESCGETEWSNTIKCACIKIVSKEEYGNDRSLAFDFEQVLVHELLHIKFGLLDTMADKYEEVITDNLRHQILDDLARALVMAKRGKTKREINQEIKRVSDMQAEK